MKKLFIYVIFILEVLTLQLMAKENCLAPLQQLSPMIIHHLSILNDKGFHIDSSKIKNPHYDRFGYFIFDYKIEEKDSYIQLKFEQSKVFDIDGEIDVLMFYLENYLFSLKNKSSNEKENIIRANLRYLLFKRLVKFRRNAKKYLPKIREYLDTYKEPNKVVRDEVAVALRMIQDDSATIITGGKRLNIWFVSYEVAPFIKKGGLGDVAGTLPRVMQNKRGHNVGTILPYWSVVNDKIIDNPSLQPKLCNDIAPFYIDGEIFTIYESIVDNTPVYLLKNEIFDIESDAVEKGLSSEEINAIKNDIYRKDLDRAHGEYIKNLNPDNPFEYENKKYEIHPENAKRAIQFSKASVKAIELLSKSTNKVPDIVVTADWQSALVPALIKKTNNNFFHSTKSVHTIHNLLFKGLFSKNDWALTGLDFYEFKKDDFMDGEFYGYASLMKLGIVHSDSVVTVSPTYANEIQTREKGQGFSELFKVVGINGIINGIPRRELNSYVMSDGIPMTINPDEYDMKLGVKNIPEGKKLNKQILREQFGLKQYDENKPLICFVGRLTEQKGLDVFLPVIKKLLESNQAQFLIVGEGDIEIENEFKDLMIKHKDNFHWEGGFIAESLVKKIFAASDLNGMPSKEEPCGLTQIQSMRYGCIDIVSDVGGLHDTVVDFYDEYGNENLLGNGYVVKGDLTPENLGAAFDKALYDYHDSKKWNNQVLKTLKLSEKFSWENSAEEYERIMYQLVGHFDSAVHLTDYAA